MEMFRFATIAALTALISVPALASEIKYRPVNPHFGGSPLNSTHLQFEASSNNQHQNDDQTATTSSISDLVRRSVSLQIANTINAKIFGDSATAEGTDLLGDGGFISWSRDVNDVVTINLTEADGTVTTFQVSD